jgi:hypothetical protein
MSFLRALSSSKSNPKRHVAWLIFHSRYYYSQLRVCAVLSKPGPLTPSRPVPANLGSWPGPAGAAHSRAPRSTVPQAAFKKFKLACKRARAAARCRHWQCRRQPGCKVGAAGPRCGVTAEHPGPARRAIRVEPETASGSLAAAAAPPRPPSRTTTRRLGGRQSPSCLQGWVLTGKLVCGHGCQCSEVGRRLLARGLLEAACSGPGRIWHACRSRDITCSAAGLGRQG